MNIKRLNWWLGSVVLPTSLSGLQYWYDLSQETGFVDGNTMPQITDFSGNGHHLVQASAGNRGLYKTNIQNGRPSIFLPGGANFYTPINGNSDTNFLHTGPSTVIWIIKPTDVFGIFHLFDSGKVTLTNRGRTIRIAATGKVLDAILNGTGTAVAGGTTELDNRVPVNEASLVVSLYENGNSGDDFDLSVGGVSHLVDETHSAPSALGASLTARFFSDTDFALNFKGHLLWAAAWNRRLSATELNQLLGGAEFGL